MALISLNCPSCNGDIQLDDTRNTGFCMYCGNKVLVKGNMERIKIDNSHLIENYRALADAAFDAENFKEVEDYCNKILEIQPQDYIAWSLKGETIAWETGIYDKGFSKTISYWKKAIQYCEDRAELNSELLDAVEALSKALIDYRITEFVENADEEQLNGFLNDIEEINRLNNFLLENDIVLNLDEKNAYLFESLKDAGVRGFKETVYPRYEKQHKKLYRRQFNELMEGAGNCEDILLKAVEIFDKDIDALIDIYKHLNIINEACIAVRAWRTNESSANIRDVKLSDEGIKYRKKTIQENNAKIADLINIKRQQEEQEKHERILTYWRQNPDKKMELEKELKDLEEKYQIESNSLLNKLFNSKALYAIESQIKLIKKELTMDR